MGWKNNMEATHTPTNFRIEEVEDTLFHFPCFLTSLHGKERRNTKYNCVCTMDQDIQGLCCIFIVQDTSQSSVNTEINEARQDLALSGVWVPQGY